VKPRTPSALVPVLDKTGGRPDTASPPQGRSLLNPSSGEPGGAPPALFCAVFIGIYNRRFRPGALRYRLALRIGCDSTLQAILSFENMPGTIDLSPTDGVVIGIPPIELSSIWACQPPPGEGTRPTPRAALRFSRSQRAALKSEARNPKSEGNQQSEIRRACGRLAHFGFRASDFLRFSDCGSRQILTPRRVRAPGLHPPQNRPLVGRVPSPGAPISSIMSRPPGRPSSQLWPRMCFLAGSEAVHVLGIGKPLNQKARRALPLCASLGRHFLQPAANNETVKCIGNVHGSAIY